MKWDKEAIKKLVIMAKEGKSNKEMADEFGITGKAIGVRKSNLRKKGIKIEHGSKRPKGIQDYEAIRKELEEEGLQ